MKRIFLLGGYDLEMLTIRGLLKQYKETYYDEELRWDNALLSAYQNVLNQYGDNNGIVIYGIELRESSTIKNYTNYILLDHHNDKSDKPSVLIQVAEILRHQLTRYEQLVAANDSNYIPGMVKFGANEKEIEDIRRKDRAAQGVSNEDEKLAEQAIKDGMRKINDLIIIKSNTSRFSPITDRLYPCEKLLIYTDSEWMYYGKGVNQIIQLFQNESIFYGGGTSGFVGIPKDKYTQQEIEQMKNQIIETIINTK